MTRLKLLVISISLIFINILVFPHNVAASILSNWVPTTNLSYEIASHASYYSSNNVGIFGGATGIATSSVQNSIIQSDFSLGPWNEDVEYIDEIYWHAYTKNDGYIYGLGGSTFPPQTSIHKVALGTLSNGKIESWSETTPLPKALSLGAAAINGNYIYFTGGFGGPTSNNVYFSEINPADGTLIAWNNTTDLPFVIEGHGLIATNNKLILIGGRQSPTIYSNKVYIANINPGGTLDAWVETHSLPTNIYRSAITKIGKYIVSVGGVIDPSGQRTNKVYYTKINDDGTINPWQTSETNFPLNICCGSLAASDTHLYHTGGVLLGGNYRSEVYFASLNNPTINPIVFLPGYGGSFNYFALIYNINIIPDTWWGITPFISVYDGLIKTLENNGYQKGTNLFIYPYDWRKNANITAENLEEYINENVLLPNGAFEKVDIIGHSFGGIIARTYTQNNPDKVGKLLTVGSPHKGVAKTYKIWEGADFSDSPYWQEILLRLYIQKNSGSFVSNVKTIHELSPSLLNTWPTFDFVKDNNGNIKPNGTLTWQNNFLPSIESGLPNILDLFSTISGNKSSSTTRFIKVQNRSTIDTLLGKWIDGKPVYEYKEDGDETVLLSSSSLDGVNNYYLNGLNHSQIISTTTGIQKILETLGIDGNVEAYNFEDLQNLIIITVASPVTFEVITPNSETLYPIDNLLIINNPKSGNYEVKIIGTEDGKYEVFFGRIKKDDEAWSSIQDQIITGQIKTHDFDVDLNSPDLGSDPILSSFSLINLLKSLIRESDTSKTEKIVMITELEKIENSIKLINKANNEVVFENMFQQLNTHINHINLKFEVWPWISLNAEERNNIYQNLNKILTLAEEEYKNKF